MTDKTHDPYVLPDGLPVPVDDGAADRLVGAVIPTVTLPSSEGDIDLDDFAERFVLYVYPETGPPEKPITPGWDEVPGARGCTPQSCGFRDLYSEIRAFGARVAALSAQPITEQLEFAARTGMPFPIISDEDFVLATTFRLPTFEFGGRRFYKRLTLIAERGTVVKVFYPVFPPDLNASDVLAWLRSSTGRVVGRPVPAGADSTKRDEGTILA